MFRAAVSTVLAVSLSIALAGTCRANLTFQTPAGINPGQSFNVVFYDSIGSGATSTNIADYNAAVTSAASNIQYAGGTIGSWSVIGCTASVDESGGLFGSSLPVYDVLGNLLASTGGDYQSTGPSPSRDQTGALFPDYPVWTGLISLGIPPGPGDPQYTLGGGFFPSYGLSGYPPPADAWGGLTGGSTENYSPADIRGLYGYAVFTARLPGDANGDGKVDFADVLALVQNYGTSSGATWMNGDFNGDGRVDFSDVLILIQHYGQSVPMTALATIPEPTQLALLPLVVFLRRRPCRK